jgi:thiol-disulfide isomerase/thioredoxin
MKKILLISGVLLITIVGCKRKQTNVSTIQINIKNYPAKEIIISPHEQGGKIDIVKLSEDGTINYKIDSLFAAKRYSIVFYKDSTKSEMQGLAIYVTPGSEIRINVDNNDFYNTLTFKGDNIELNEYYRMMLLFGMKSEPIIRQSKSIDIFTQRYDSAYFAHQKFLNAISQKDSFITRFCKDENDILRIYYYMNVLDKFNKLKYYKTNDLHIKELEENVLNDSIIPKNQDIFWVSYVPLTLVYLEYLMSADTFNNKLTVPAHKEIAEKQTTIIKYELIKKKIKVKPNQESMLFCIVGDWVSRHGKKDMDSILMDFSELCTNPEYIKSFDKSIIEHNNDSLIGLKAPLIKCFDINDKPVLLSDFDKTVTVIDFWTSGCGGCIVAMKYLDTICKKLGEGEIKIYNISVDAPKRKSFWKYRLERIKSSNVQLFAGENYKTVSELYKLWCTPCYVVIDKKGIIRKVSIPELPKEDFLKRLISE